MFTFSILCRAIALSTVVAALHVGAAADDSDRIIGGYDFRPDWQLIELLTKISRTNPDGASAAAGFYFCNTEVAEVLAIGGTWKGVWSPRSADPLDKRAAKAVELCAKEEAALVQPSELRAIKALILKINTETIEHAWRKEAGNPFEAPASPPVPFG